MELVYSICISTPFFVAWGGVDKLLENEGDDIENIFVSLRSVKRS